MGEDEKLTLTKWLHTAAVFRMGHKGGASYHSYRPATASAISPKNMVTSKQLAQTVEQAAFLAGGLQQPILFNDC
jgi:hypothetical protein